MINEYLAYRQTLGYSKHQEKVLVRFDSYCTEHHPDIKTITKEAARGWINYEKTHGYGDIESKVSAVRMLALYMGGGAYILPTTNVPKKVKYVPYILTDEELTRFFATVDNIKGKTKNSIKLMFPTLLRLLYTCGLRPNEVRTIKRDNINLTTGEIFIEKTKNHKERIVVMSDDMLKQCRKYDVIRGIENPLSEYFFVCEDGVPVTAIQLKDTFRLIWRQANHGVPLKKLPRLRAYDLRHRFASTVLQKWLCEKRDLYTMLPYLRAYMGHENFYSTAYYIHLLPENLLCSSGVDWKAIDSVNPKESIWKN